MTTTQTYYHTSPEPIVAISPIGLFGDGLCFSAHPYSMSRGPVVTYAIALADDEIVDVSDIDFDSDALADIVSDVESAGIDRETAVELLSERTSAHYVDIDDPAELSWELQRLALVAAKRLGFRAVRGTDEQGSVVIVSMLGREPELTEVES